MGTAGLEDGSPTAGSRDGGRVSTPQKSDIQQNNLQLSNAFLRRFVAESVFHLPNLPLKNSSDLRESHDPTRPGQGGHVRVDVPTLPTRGYATVSQSNQLPDRLGW